MMLKTSLHNKVINLLTKGSTIFFIFLTGMLIISLLINSRASIQKFGLSFVTKDTWNIKFLELTKVYTQNNNTIILQFSNVLKEQELSDMIRVTLNNSNFSYLLANDGIHLKIHSSSLMEGQYQIFISPYLKDIYDNKITEEFVWSGYINSNYTISEFTLINSKNETVNYAENNENYRYFNILPFIIGTILSSLLALLIAFPVALASAILLVEYSHPKSGSMKFFAVLIDLLAGIPSVIFGLWGLFFLVPKFGANLFTASLILAIMIMPYAASLSREAISLVPNKIKQAGFGLGATKSQVILNIILPYAKSGIIAGVLLTLGRALGETLAVTMVIGNRNQIPKSLFDPAQTISSLIANEYGEAGGLKQSALIEAGIVLIIITLFFSLLGRMIIKHSNNRQG